MEGIPSPYFPKYIRPDHFFEAPPNLSDVQEDSRIQSFELAPEPSSGANNPSIPMLPEFPDEQRLITEFLFDTQ
jgi:hypothetical protein